MPKTKFQNVVYTIIMALIMVYGMIVYNVALNTGGVTNATFGMALHELPIMMPIATLLFKEPSFGTWVQTWGLNMPMALIWQLLFSGPLTRVIFRALFRRQLTEEAAAH